MRYTSVGSGVVLALALAGCATESGDGEVLGAGGAELGTAAVVPPADPMFTVKALGRMCLDFGGQAYWAVGSPVTLYWCNGTVAQQVGVREVSGFHDVTLHVGTQFCIGARGGAPVAGAPLELQTCNGSDAQEFALDGDSIIAGHRRQLVEQRAVQGAARAAATIGGIGGIGGFDLPINREFVVKPQGDVTGAKTPLVLGRREVTEPEYLRLVPLDKSARAPHSGFVRPSDGADLVAKLRAATWGTVVELMDGTYDVTTLETPIAEGVTLRGYRKLTDEGPLITSRSNTTSPVFTIAANDVRVTGLRLFGPSDAIDADRGARGIQIFDGNRVLVDHIELSHFTEAALIVDGADGAEEKACPANPPPMPRPTPVRVVRNFSHNNEANNGGYGFASWQGAFPLFEGNVEYLNRHSIACDYRGSTGYIAQDNLVLSRAPSYYAGFYTFHDFDVHGSDNPWWDSTLYQGGFAGDYVHIQWNTFFGTDRTNVKIRGQQCRKGLLDGNVFRQSRGDAVDNLDTDADSTSTPVNFDITSNNAFGVDDPSLNLAAGDFDGDGIDDVFMGTGVGWYYSSGGQSEWRHLRRATELASELRFADLDGDGRTDVVTVRKSGTLDVSWGGVSSWRFLSNLPAPVPITDIAAGNFDGDTFHGQDLFLTTGSAWFVASSGRNWLPAQTSRFPMSALRFGDFDHDGKTDVFSMNGGKYSISSAAQGSWTALGGPSTTNLDWVIVGDFDGDGTADVGVTLLTQPFPQFYVSSGGRAGFQLARTLTSLVVVAGRFEGGRRTDVLFLSPDRLQYLAGAGVGTPLQLWSRQDMR